MPLIDQRRTFAFPLPHEVIHDRDTVISAPMYLDGSELTVASGAIVITDQDGNTRVSDSVSISGGRASYTIPAATFTSDEVSEFLHVRWSLVVSGTTYYGENDGIVVVRELHPVISDEDVYRAHQALNPASATKIHTYDDLQDFIDDAWTELIGDMISDGTRPGWVMSPSALRKPHIALTKAKIFEDLSSHLNTAYEQTAKDWRRRYREAYGAMGVLIDTDEDGELDSATRQGVAPSGIWLV